MTRNELKKIRVIDSHTGGEPTRVIIEGGPDLGTGPLKERLEQFRFDFDRYRSAVANEPRGSDPVVGALLCPPSNSNCTAAVIFFNNVGYLGMCGHGTIGLVATLAYMGRLEQGEHLIETPVGIVTASLHDDGSVSFVNVPCYRRAKGVTVGVPGLGPVTGDVAWGGNWFFLAEAESVPLEPDNIGHLADLCRRIRAAVNAHGFPEVDHIELFGPPRGARADSRNYVLCPGGAYDRSPCGTGTCAKLACLAADGKLAEGVPWVQESIIGSLFTGRYCRNGDQILPSITGSAYISAEATLVLDENDPFCWGIR
ncbi:MAG TPA: proline racemase family protein [Acidobacteriota bacterium]|nr:proline racemase family protein [Acidobacteriota bacterium]